MKYVVDAGSRRKPVLIEGHLRMGGSNPAGEVINANSLYLTRGGKPWLPVMGEFHFTRFPHGQWEEELLKMKAGGIQIVATYVFWIHHEEIEGSFEWSGDKDLRKFVKLCRKNGLEVLVRIGPWAHGECRNGGFPDWIYGRCALRTNDEDYLRYVRKLYEEIDKQIEGLSFQDGGPIVGIQFDNELTDNAEHLRTLKSMARGIGMQAPLYTVTGWGGPGGARIPKDEVLPLFGGYPDHPWDKHTNPLPPGPHYFFHSVRNDPSIGSDLFGEKAAEIKDLEDIERYPDGCCELGGGVQITYHRRPVIQADDVAAMAMIKIANGCNLLGYYMYHGGTQPIGQLATMQESNPQGNQLPVRSYDFQAPIGEFGGIRDSYRKLKRLHLFVHDFGERLAPMTAAYPQARPSSLEDTDTVRVAARTNGDSGFLFFNNYQRLTEMADKDGVQVELRLPGGDLNVPANGFTLKKDAYFFWPFHMDLDGARLKYATAQPLCLLRGDGETTYVFFEVPGVKPEFTFDPATVADVQAKEGTVLPQDGALVVRDLLSGLACEFVVRSVAGHVVKVLTITEEQSLHLWKGQAFGDERLIVCEGNVAFGEDDLRISGTGADTLAFAVYPPVEHSIACGGVTLTPFQDKMDIFQTFKPSAQTREVEFSWKPTRDPSLNGDFFKYLFEDKGQEGAAPEWEIRIDAKAFDEANDVTLIIDFIGDVAQAYIGGQCIADQFYNGVPWRIGLKRFREALASEPIVLKISPLLKKRDIYMPSKPPEDCRSEILALSAEAEYTIVIDDGKRGD
ncbi:beta-galactosidase [Cohnella herbarum]|uniref:Glycoside hydrolase family 35 n=1 Tax=Cohnella herbarum TaxID=2728023 RepID=A0A7Z2VQL0_9BACL|nr:beta-galactosidase [Cohnella herbarum]QJD87120.1 glycoside hydrolase family 35 [Cohnella herbarum]